jgi:hypothetical protein
MLQHQRDAKLARWAPKFFRVTERRDSWEKRQHTLIAKKKKYTLDFTDHD